MFSLHVSPCRLLYWFSRPLSARTHYRSTSAHIECYLDVKQDGFFDWFIDLNLLYFLQYISLWCSVNRQYIQFLQYAFLVFLRVYSMRPHIDTPKFLFAIFSFTFLSAYLLLSALYHSGNNLSSANLMKFWWSFSNVLYFDYSICFSICQVLFYEDLMKF